MTVGGILAMGTARGLYMGAIMMRIALAQRLIWLEDGHEEDTAYNYAQAQKLLGMTMHRYFSGAQRALQDLLLNYIGFSMEAGTTGESEHPFTMGFSKEDVRVTNHFHEQDVLSAIFCSCGDLPEIKLFTCFCK